MIIGAMLVRNEAGRYLERVLEQMQKVCDQIAIVDDASTDDTVEICKRYGADVQLTVGPNFEINEFALRRMLWACAAAKCKSGDWILCLDADETIPDIENLSEMIKMSEKHSADSLGFRLHDMWDETHYRDDEHWTAHKRFWPVCVRYNAGKNYLWNEQPLHCGRFPWNASERTADAKMNIQHWGWSRPEDRKHKYDFYKRIDTKGLGIPAQYESILDEHPNLRLFGLKRVLIGAPVHQTEQIFKLYLDSLDRLDASSLEVDWAFILHNCDLVCLAESYKRSDRQVISESITDDVKYRRGEDTHHWHGENLSVVARMRNSLLLAACVGGYDYIFSVDSDLILHPQTLQQLVKADKPIISNVFWTRWAPENPEMPNAWMYDSYGNDDEHLQIWREPGLYRVGMTGACTLIRREVIEAGVNYSPISNVSFSAWEDRAFCIRAACAGFDIWMDTTYPAFHIYRDSDVQEVMANEAR